MKIFTILRRKLPNWFIFFKREPDITGILFLIKVIINIVRNNFPRQTDTYSAAIIAITCLTKNANYDGLLFQIVMNNNTTLRSSV